MMYKLLVKAEAILDMKEAFDWYETKRTGLGAEFLDEVDDGFNRITQNPEHYQSHREQRVLMFNLIFFDRFSKLLFVVDFELHFC